MRWVHCIVVSFVIFSLLSSSASADPSVWTGPTLTFSKASGVDPLLPENQDHLTDNVQFTRNDFQGLLNASVDCDALECIYSDNSPQGTEWATELQNPGETISATNWAELTFVDWEVAYGDAGLLQQNVTSLPAVVHLIADDVYLDLQFTQWGTHGAGNFEYQRSTPVPEPATIPLALAGLSSFGVMMSCRPKRPLCRRVKTT